MTPVQAATVAREAAIVVALQAETYQTLGELRARLPDVSKPQLRRGIDLLLAEGRLARKRAHFAMSRGGQWEYRLRTPYQ